MYSLDFVGGACCTGGGGLRRAGRPGSNRQAGSEVSRGRWRSAPRVCYLWAIRKGRRLLRSMSAPRRANPIGPTFKLEGADAKIAALLGTKADDITINDVVVEPGTNIAYVSVSRGKGPSAEPAIVRVDGKGNVTALPLDKVAYAKVSLANAPARRRRRWQGNRSASQAITDLAYVDGKLFIAGLSNEEFASKLRSIEFPFKAADTGASVEIIHTAHNAAVETRSPVRTFVPFNVGGQPQFSRLTPARRS